MKTMQLWWSSIGKKLIAGITGIALVLFLIVHLGGNLTLFFGNGALFNSYSHHLEALGPLLWVAEIGLVILFVSHMVSTLSVRFGGKQARGTDYALEASKGGASKKTLSSRTMAITGTVLGIFLVLHVIHFKFGASYPLEINGKEARDLYRLVNEEFHKPLIAFLYAGVMLLLGVHLRHGFWSALQSLGAMKPKYSPLIYTLGLVFAILLAGGFLVLPLWIYFMVPAP